jgi:ubiquinone/menaquinone biosynthesis C-methylase UbiE
LDITHSYDFDRFSDANRRAETKRLYRQATVLLERELAILRTSGLAPGQEVLEIGCGPGFITGALSSVANPGRAKGIDTSAELLEVARTLVEPAHANVSFELGNAYETRLPSASFDFVYSRLLYQHLDRPLAALEEARRVTRPGGRVCVLDVDDGWLTHHPPNKAFDELTRLAREAQAAHGGDRLIGRKLPGLMTRAGFEKVGLQVTYASTLDFDRKTFLDITTRFKAIQINTPVAYALVEEIERTTDDSDGVPFFGVVGVFCAVGTV